MVKAYVLRKENCEELLKKVNDLKKDLMVARSRVKGQQAQRTGRIKTIRKDIARALTVFNEKRREAAKSQFKGKKFVPKELKPKLTRALRRRLSKKDQERKPARVVTREKNFPQRRYALLLA